jgi:hypothetical protein
MKYRASLTVVAFLAGLLPAMAQSTSPPNTPSAATVPNPLRSQATEAATPTAQTEAPRSARRTSNRTQATTPSSAPQPQTATAQPSATPVVAEPAKDAAKPKRERSARQLQSDEDMRACGTSWRTDKEQLKAKGETWRSYLKTCRTARKAARGEA